MLISVLFACSQWAFVLFKGKFLIKWRKQESCFSHLQKQTRLLLHVIICRCSDHGNIHFKRIYRHSNTYQSLIIQVGIFPLFQPTLPCTAVSSACVYPHRPKSFIYLLTSCGYMKETTPTTQFWPSFHPSVWAYYSSINWCFLLTRKAIPKMSPENKHCFFN